MLVIHASRPGISVTAEGVGPCCDDTEALADEDAVAMLLGPGSRVLLPRIVFDINGSIDGNPGRGYLSRDAGMVRMCAKLIWRGSDPRWLHKN